MRKMQEQKDVRLFTYWQLIYSIQTNPGKKAEEYASLLGMPTEKVYRIVQLYNKNGGFDKQNHWGGRRDQRSHLSYEKEQVLMKGLEKQAQGGKIITMNDIRAVVEKQVGHSVSDDYLWDLFKRHGWKKKAPRPQHPQKDQAAQQAFKKNSLSCWSPADSKQ
jgi:transposase